MEKIKHKIKKELDTQALADFLCRLGNEFTTRHTLSGADIANPFERLELLELKIKPKGAGFSVRIKTEHAQMPDKGLPYDSPELSGDTAETYKEVKKRMKTSFQAIGDRLNENRLPDADLVEVFVADSEKMIRYPDCGEPFYAPFRSAVEKLSSAHREKDYQRFTLCFQELKRLRNQCHARFQ